jgi:hypothetical protein
MIGMAWNLMKKGVAGKVVPKGTDVTPRDGPTCRCRPQYRNRRGDAPVAEPVIVP